MDLLELSYLRFEVIVDWTQIVVEGLVVISAQVVDQALQVFEESLSVLE